jgi:hypothetical protein
MVRYSQPRRIWSRRIADVIAMTLLTSYGSLGLVYVQLQLMACFIVVTLEVCACVSRWLSVSCLPRGMLLRPKTMLSRRTAWLRYCDPGVED